MGFCLRKYTSQSLTSVGRHSGSSSTDGRLVRSYPSNGNSQRFFSSHQSAMHLDQLQQKSREYSWKNASYLGPDMQKPCPNALPSYAARKAPLSSFPSDTMRKLLHIHFLPKIQEKIIPIHFLLMLQENLLPIQILPMMPERSSQFKSFQCCWKSPPIQILLILQEKYVGTMKCWKNHHFWNWKTIRKLLW